MVSSIGDHATPWRAKISLSYLMFWPIFSTPGSSSSGFKQLEGLVAGAIWSGAGVAIARQVQLAVGACAPAALWRSGM